MVSMILSSKLVKKLYKTPYMSTITNISKGGAVEIRILLNVMALISVPIVCLLLSKVSPKLHSRFKPEKKER